MPRNRWSFSQMKTPVNAIFGVPSTLKMLEPPRRALLPRDQARRLAWLRAPANQPLSKPSPTLLDLEHFSCCWVSRSGRAVAFSLVENAHRCRDPSYTYRRNALKTNLSSSRPAPSWFRLPSESHPSPFWRRLGRRPLQTQPHPPPRPSEPAFPHACPFLSKTAPSPNSVRMRFRTHSPHSLRLSLTASISHLWVDGKTHSKSPSQIHLSKLHFLFRTGFGNLVPLFQPLFMRFCLTYPLFHLQRRLLREVFILSLCL